MLPWADLSNAFGVHAGARLRRETTGDGLEREGMHWPDLDEDISAENLLLGKTFRRKSGLISAVAGWAGDRLIRRRRWIISAQGNTLGLERIRSVVP